MTTNVDRIYSENPVLSMVISRTKVAHAQVKRWSASFLEHAPDSYPDSGTEKIFFIDEHGNKIARVGNRWDDLLDFLLQTGVRETIGQALARIGKDETRKIKFAVSEWSGNLMFWKLPNSFANAADWLAAK